MTTGMVILMKAIVLEAIAMNGVHGSSISGWGT